MMDKRRTLPGKGMDKTLYRGVTHIPTPAAMQTHPLSITHVYQKHPMKALFHPNTEM